MGHNSKSFSFPDLKPTSLDLYQSDVRVNYAPIGHGNPENASREEVSAFTARSRMRLAFVASNTAVDFHSMITLTYPNAYPHDGKQVKKHLNNLLTRLRQRYPGLDYLWFLEFQKRGAPHVHILMSVKSDKGSQTWLSAAWFKVVGSNDQKHLAAGTQFVNCRKADGAKRYAVKYSMKMKQKAVPELYRNVGRFWGHSKNVKPRPMVEGVPVEDDKHLARLLQGWDYRHKLDTPMAVLYNASVVVAQQLIQDAVGDESSGIT